MRQGKTVPVYIQSSDSQILVASLKEWYNTNQVAKPPLLSSIKLETMKEILPLRKEYDYAFSIVLPNQIQPDNRDQAYPIRRKFLSKEANSIFELYSLTKRTFNKALDKYIFEPKEIFFELCVCPLEMDL